MMDEIIHVGFGECKCSKNPNSVLVSYGLGSCVAVTFYDKSKQIGGMIHVVLPSNHGRPTSMPSRFADTGIPILVENLLKMGAAKHELIVKMVGGAKILRLRHPIEELDIGARNVAMCREILKKLGFRIHGQETGGTHGRTVRFHIGTGETFVRQRGEKQI